MGWLCVLVLVVLRGRWAWYNRVCGCMVLFLGVLGVVGWFGVGCLGGWGGSVFVWCWVLVVLWVMGLWVCCV